MGIWVGGTDLCGLNWDWKETVTPVSIFYFFLPVTPRREKCDLCKAQHKWGGSRNWETLSCQLWMQPNCCATILTGLRWRESRGCWPALQHSWNSKQQEPGAETLHPGFSHSPRLSLSLSPSFFFPFSFVLFWSFPIIFLIYSVCL